MTTFRSLAVFSIAVGIAIFLGCHGAAPQRAAETGIELVNGQWWNGHEFQERAFYIADGLLTSTRPQSIESVLDLEGGYVVPPYGEAHNHNVTSPPQAKEIQTYLNDGIFYVMVQNNRAPTEPTRPTELDVAYANGGLTHPEGHVVELNHKLLGWGVYPDLEQGDLDGRVFHTIRDQADLDAKWDRILATSPDFIKIFLGFSGEQAEREGKTRYFGAVGLDPEVIPLIVEKAHAAGLRVSAHIETAEDFRLAVSSRVDIVAHLPAWRIGADAGYDEVDVERWILTVDDAIQAGINGVAVITTVLAGSTTTDPEHEHFETVWSIHRRNIDTLRQAGVTLAIGSDLYRGTSVAEAFVLGRQQLAEPLPALGVFDNRDLLRAWCMTTPRLIFPDRKIGILDDEYEASFLVLEDNPLDDFVNVRRIKLRVKNGVVLEIASD